jgi:hypothetical protein
VLPTGLWCHVWNSFWLKSKIKNHLKKEIKDRKNPAWLTSYLLQTAWFLYSLYYIVWNLERFTLLTTLNYSDLRSIQEGWWNNIIIVLYITTYVIETPYLYTNQQKTKKVMAAHILYYVAANSNQWIVEIHQPYSKNGPYLYQIWTI